MDTPAIHRLTDMTIDECLDSLRTQSLGRLVYDDGGETQIRPLTYAVHQGSVVFRIGYGDLLDTIHQQQVIFEADNGDDVQRTGWSVIIRGIAEEIWQTDELEKVRESGLRPWAPGDRDHYVRVIPTAMSGRRIA